MFAYLRFESLRTVRQPAFLVFTVGFPLAVYLVEAGLFKESGGLGGIGVAQYLMVSMAAYGCIQAAFSATGPRLAHERQSGWLRQLDTTPLTAWSVVAGKALAGMVVTLPAVALVFLFGALVEGVRLQAWQWLALLAASWVGALPFTTLGVLIGSAASVDVAQPLGMGVMFIFYMFGGIFLPLQVLPAAMAQLAKVLPSYRYAGLGWAIAAGHGPTGADLLVLGGWTIAFVIAATVAYRRSTQSS